MNKVRYKKYEIEAKPYQLSESKKWAINLLIRHDQGSEVREMSFSAANTFETKKEAIQHCIDFGREIIDGKVANCTIGDL